jgi:hypothetical protein
MPRKRRVRLLQRQRATKARAIGQLPRRNVRWGRPPRPEVPPEAVAAPDLVRAARPDAVLRSV